MVTWLQSAGYRLTSAPFLSSIEASRGSVMGNLGSLNPKTWVSRVRATFTALENGCEIEIDWRISTLGQVVTKTDMEYWAYEMERTMGAALGAMPNMDEFLAISKRAASGNVWRALIFTVAILLPLIFALFVMPWYGALLITALTGTAAWLALRAPREFTVQPPRAGPPIIRNL